jgi:hypothetical protein
MNKEGTLANPAQAYLDRELEILALPESSHWAGKKRSHPRWTVRMRLVLRRLRHYG